MIERMLIRSFTAFDRRGSACVLLRPFPRGSLKRSVVFAVFSINFALNMRGRLDLQLSDDVLHEPKKFRAKCWAPYVISEIYAVHRATILTTSWRSVAFLAHVPMVDAGQKLEFRTREGVRLWKSDREPERTIFVRRPFRPEDRETPARMCDFQQLDAGWVRSLRHVVSQSRERRCDGSLCHAEISVQSVCRLQIWTTCRKDTHVAQLAWREP